MDDLFRKAGDLYPLKTTESDWDGVLGKLMEEGKRNIIVTLVDHHNRKIPILHIDNQN